MQFNFELKHIFWRLSMEVNFDNFLDIAESEF